MRRMSYGQTPDLDSAADRPRPVKPSKKKTATKTLTKKTTKRTKR